MNEYCCFWTHKTLLPGNYGKLLKIWIELSHFKVKGGQNYENFFIANKLIPINIFFFLFPEKFPFIVKSREAICICNLDRFSIYIDSSLESTYLYKKLFKGKKSRLRLKCIFHCLGSSISDSEKNQIKVRFENTSD